MFHIATAFAPRPIGQATAETASPVASKPMGRGEQHALHVIDYNSWKALAHLRAIGACGRKASRRLSDDEFDDQQFSRENGDGEIY